MNIEENIFKRTHVIYDKLIKYGFVKEKNNYKYSTNINNDFRVDIIINNNKVTGKIIDINFNEEYIGYKLDNELGEFASKIKKEYISILKDIRTKCFIVDLFNSDISNKLTDIIYNKYKDKPEFLWDDTPNCGVFRSKLNKKWYGIIMNIDYSKIDSNRNGMVEVINVKLNTDTIKELINKDGFYKAYHMNKNHWISITLDGRVDIDKILELIDISHSFTTKGREWLIPANPKYYDIVGNIEKSIDGIINWKQSTNIEVGDIIYMYVALPYSCILYKFKAIEVNIPYSKETNLNIKTIMKIKILEKYSKDIYNKDILNKYGIKAIRGPRIIPSSLSKLLNKEDNK